MAFGVKRKEVNAWKKKVEKGEIAFLTHFWLDPRFPHCNSVTKVGCSDTSKLVSWGAQYNLHPSWIHQDPDYPHFDLFGEKQKEILQDEGQWDQLNRFRI